MVWIISFYDHAKFEALLDQTAAFRKEVFKHEPYHSNRLPITYTVNMDVTLKAHM